MQPFSISAPQWTEEDQQREKDALSEEERLTIQRDVDGSARFVETEEMATRGLQEFQQELSCLPDEKKEAYLEAMRRAPHLVETETNPIKFLRCEHFDAKKAAHRMVQNWQVRLQVFGETKAFEPMTLDGALSDDESVLMTGFFQCLRDDVPNNRAIIVKDRPKLNISSIKDRNSAHRVMWYMFHVASLNPFTQRNGAVVVVDAQQYGMEHFDRKLSRKMWQLLECAPFQLSAIHFCTAMSRSTYSIIIPSVLALMGRRNRLRTIHHRGPQHTDELMACGLSKEWIPCELGGLVTMEMYVRWVEKKREMERGEQCGDNSTNDNGDDVKQ